MRWLVFLTLLALPIFSVQAATLTFVSDTIGKSAPSAAANHTIKFTATSAIPASGKINLIFTSFSLPSSLDYSDIDLLVNGANLPLAGTAGSGAGSAIGVAVSSASKSITLTLNSSNAIAAGNSIIIKIGANAVYEATGDQQISNPSSAGSYKIHLETKNSGSVVLDSADAMVAVLASISMSAVPPPSPTIPPSPVAPSGGGGGGGGGGMARIFSAPPVVVLGTSTIQTPPAPHVVVFIHTLRVGLSGEEVKRLQMKLKELGYFRYPKITGFFGPVTRAAVIAFQRARGLKPYPGWVGPATRAALNRL